MRQHRFKLVVVVSCALAAVAIVAGAVGFTPTAHADQRYCVTIQSNPLITNCTDITGLGYQHNGWWYSTSHYGCCSTNYSASGPENFQYGQTGSWADRLQWASPNFAKFSGSCGCLYNTVNVWIWIGIEDATACGFGWVQDATGQHGFWLPEGANSGWYYLGNYYSPTQEGDGIFVSLTNQMDSSKCGSGNGGNLIAGSSVDFEGEGTPIGG